MWNGLAIQQHASACSAMQGGCCLPILLTDHMVVCVIQVGADVAALAAALRKPLRPLWVSQNSLIWLDRVPDVADLGFTPLLLVSASLPNARQRRIAGERRLQPPLCRKYYVQSILSGAAHLLLARERHVATLLWLQHLCWHGLHWALLTRTLG